MDLKERLQFGRKRANLTQAEVARALGVTPQAVSQWERGEAEPANEKLLPLAKLYGVTVGRILGDDEPMVEEGVRPAPEILGPRDLKVFAPVEGGPGEMVVSTDPVELVPRPWYMREVRDGYAVLVVGESMIPAFEPGDMAVVNPRLPPMRGKDVILIADEQQGEFRASIKRLESWDAKHWHLRQFNPPRGQKPELTWAKKDRRRPCAWWGSTTAAASGALLV